MVLGKSSVALAVALLMVAGLPAVSQPSGELNQEILAQEGNPITFYGHLFSEGAGNPMPMNTQYPDSEADYSIGARDTDGCNFPPEAPTATDGANCVATSIFFYTTAGFVQIKERLQFAYNKLHNERGQTKDIYFDTSVPISTTIYQSADAHGWPVLLGAYGVAWNWDPGYMPDWTQETRVWHANMGPWSSDPDAKPNMGVVTGGDGVLVASGTSVPMDIYSIDENINSPTCDEVCQTVWPLTAELEWDEDFVAAGGVVPYLNDLVVEIRLFSLHENGNRYILPGMVWNTNSGEDYPPTFVFPTRNPLDVELVFPRFVHDKLVVLSVLNTPWGSYDVDLDSIQIAFRDSTGKEIIPDEDKFQMFLDQSVAHSGHYDPINVTWIWDFEDQNLKPGNYDIIVSATNFQGSFSTETVATMTIESDGSGGDATAAQSGILSFTNEQFQDYQGGAEAAPGEEAEPDGAATGEAKESPGIGLLALGGVLAGLVAMRRRP